MRLQGFSASTQNNYRRYARKYLEYCGGDTGGGGIRAYLSHLREERRLTPGTVNMYNAAIRFLLEVTLDQPVNHKRIPLLRDYWRQCRPKHPEGLLFLNKDGSDHAQKRMIQVALDRALPKAGIKKEVTVHPPCVPALPPICWRTAWISLR